MKVLPPNRALPASAVQHSAPIALHSTLDLLQCPNISGNAVVRIVTAKHLVEVLNLLRDWLMPYLPHLILQTRKRASQSCLLRRQSHSKVAFLVSGAIQSQAQKINRLRTSTTTLVRIALRKATKFDKFGFRLRQSQAELPKPLAQYFLDTKGIRRQIHR